LHNKQNQLSDTNIKPQIGNNYRKSEPQSDFVKTSTFTIAKGTGENSFIHVPWPTDALMAHCHHVDETLHQSLMLNHVKSLVWLYIFSTLTINIKNNV